MSGTTSNLRLAKLAFREMDLFCQCGGIQGYVLLFLPWAFSLVPFHHDRVDPLGQIYTRYGARGR